MELISPEENSSTCYFFYLVHSQNFQYFGSHWIYEYINFVKHYTIRFVSICYAHFILKY